MNIELYTTARGKSPVEDYIDQQPKKDQAVILAILEAGYITCFQEENTKDTKK